MNALIKNLFLQVRNLFGHLSDCGSRKFALIQLSRLQRGEWEEMGGVYKRVN